MKLTYYNDFAFAGVTKQGTFAVNPEKKNDNLLFAIFTKPGRDMNLSGKFLSWPGEYEYGGIAFQLFELTDGSLASKLISESVRLVFLPALKGSLSEEEMEILGNVDVLVVEVQEMSPTLKKMVEEIDPKAVIPVGPGQEKFLAEIGAGNAEKAEIFKAEASSLPADSTLFVKLLPT